MTGYYIKLGYNGALRTDYETMWEELKKAAREIADNPHAIVAEARRLGAPETCKNGCCRLETSADNYAEPFGTSGHPLEIIEKEDERQIIQFASTSDSMKYRVRRAYVRLLIERMHKKEIEVSLIVA